VEGDVVSEGNAIVKADDQAIIESLVTKGDVSGLSSEQRAQYYVSLCQTLGLNPQTQPFAVVTLQGKAVMYPTRGATDQLAAIHRINREIIDGPKLYDLAGTKLVICVCRATHPNGRVETSTATVPLQDPANVLMKCETKAKRRATLAILGLGMPDESEVADMSGHEYAAAAAPRNDVSTPTGETPTLTVEDGDTEAWAGLCDAATAAFGSDPTAVVSVEQAVGVYLDHEADLAVDDRSRACGALHARTPKGTTKRAFNAAIKTERVKRNTEAARARNAAAEAARSARVDAVATQTPEPDGVDAPLPLADAVAQYERDFAAAQSMAEVEAIVRDVAALKLARDSAERIRLVAAHTAAVARLRPPPAGPSDADGVMDAMLASEGGRGDDDPDPSDVRDAAVEEWTAYAEAQTDAIELAAAWRAREPAHRKLGIADATLKVTAARVRALLKLVGEMESINFVVKGAPGAVRRSA
jgi:hypothetical protein